MMEAEAPQAGERVSAGDGVRAPQKMKKESFSKKGTTFLKRGVVIGTVFFSRCLCLPVRCLGTLVLLFVS